jgi:acetylornithine deacetylase
MGDILVRLDEYAASLAQETRHSMLGTASLSVGVIEGGQAVNIVPDRCWIEIDRRTLPGETIEEVLRPVRCILREVPNWSFDEPHLSVPGIQVEADATIMRILAPAITEVLGEVHVESAHYATVSIMPQVYRRSYLGRAISGRLIRVRSTWN